jgi:hypothetical protein
VPLLKIYREGKKVNKIPAVMLTLALVLTALISITYAATPPLAAFDWSPDPGIAGSPVAFDASGSSDSDGTIVSYDWDFGDGGTDTGVNPSHTFATADNYLVTLVVTDNDGLTDLKNYYVPIEEGNDFVIPEPGVFAGLFACFSALAVFLCQKRRH